MTNPSHIPKKDIEKHTIGLIRAYEKESGGPIRPPVPVFDIIEYLGYDIDFRSDGFYQDPNNLGKFNNIPVRISLTRLWKKPDEEESYYWVQVSNVITH